MINEEQKERLYQFFAAQFHQDWGDVKFYHDWGDEAKLPEEIVDKILDRYISEVDACELRELSNDIIEFVNDYQNEEELKDDLYRRLGCYVDTDVLGISAKTWLMEVAAKLTKKNVS